MGRALPVLRRTREAHAAVNASLLLEEVMNHLQQLMSELDELVRGVRHDEKLLEILQVGFDLLGLCGHLEITSASLSRRMKSGLE